MSHAPAPDAPLPSLLPIYVATTAVMAAMMGFVTMAGKIAEQFALLAWHIGLSVTVAAVFWIVAARFWGRRSDEIGRRAVLLIGVGIFAVSYAGLAAVVILGGKAGWLGVIPLVALIAARAAAGLGYAAVPAASNAYIADIAAPAARPGLMGRLGAAQALGMVSGPALVAILSRGGDLVVPFLALALLPVLALGLIFLRMTPSPRLIADRPTPLRLTDPRVTGFTQAGVMLTFAISIAQIAVGFMALDRFGSAPLNGVTLAGVALTLVGIALIPAQLTIAWLGWQPPRLMRVGSVIAATGFLLAAFAPDYRLFLAGYVLAGFGAGWVFSGMAAGMANAVEPDEQGQAAGTLAAAQGVGAMSGPLIGAVLYDLASPLPLSAAALALVGVLLRTRG